MFDQMIMYIPPVAAIILALSRALPMTKGLWSKLPAKYQYILPTAAYVLPEVAKALMDVKAPTDWVTFATFVLALVAPGSRSNAHVAMAETVAKKEEK